MKNKQIQPGSPQHGWRIPEFSFFRAPITNTKPCCTVDLNFLFDLISGENYLDVTEGLRKITEPKEARLFKAQNLDFVTPSGVFSKRDANHLVVHSGIVVLDFDHLENPEHWKGVFQNDPALETALLFISPSGNGLKWFILADLANISHKEFFQAASNYIFGEYGVRPDPSGKDISRSCFLCHDKDVLLNSEFKL